MCIYVNTLELTFRSSPVHSCIILKNLHDRQRPSPCAQPGAVPLLIRGFPVYCHILASSHQLAIVYIISAYRACHTCRQSLVSKCPPPAAYHLKPQIGLKWETLPPGRVSYIVLVCYKASEPQNAKSHQTVKLLRNATQVCIRYYSREFQSAILSSQLYYRLHSFFFLRPHWIKPLSLTSFAVPTTTTTTTTTTRESHTVCPQWWTVLVLLANRQTDCESDLPFSLVV